MRSSILRITFAFIVLAFALAPMAVVYAVNIYPPPFVPCGWHGARCEWDVNAGKPKCNPDSQIAPLCEGSSEFIDMKRPVEAYEMCRFNDFVSLATGVVNGTIILISVYAAISFMYAGYAYLTSGGSQEKVTYAKQIFYKVLIGYIVILTAWLIVYMIEMSFFSTEMQQKSFLGAGTPSKRTYPECRPDGAVPAKPDAGKPGAGTQTLPKSGYYTNPNCNGKCVDPAACVRVPPPPGAIDDGKNDDGGPSLMKADGRGTAAAVLAQDSAYYKCIVPPPDFVYDCADCAAPKRCASNPSTSDSWGNPLWRCTLPKSAPSTPGETLCPCTVPTPPPVVTPPVDTTEYYPEAFNMENCTLQNASSMYSGTDNIGIKLDPNISKIKSVKFPIYKIASAEPFDFSNSISIVGANGSVPMRLTVLGTSNHVTLSSAAIPDMVAPAVSKPFWATYNFSSDVNLTGFENYYVVFSDPSIGYQPFKTDYVTFCGSKQTDTIFYTDPANDFLFPRAFPDNHPSYYGLLGINQPEEVVTLPPPIAAEPTLCPCTETPPSLPPPPPPAPKPGAIGTFPVPFNQDDCTFAHATSMYSSSENVGYAIDPSITSFLSIRLPVYRFAQVQNFDFYNKLVIAGSNDQAVPYRLTTLGASKNSIHFTPSLLPVMGFNPPAADPYWAEYGFASEIRLAGFLRYYFYFTPPSSGYSSGGTDLITLCGSGLTGDIFYTTGRDNTFPRSFPGNYPTYYEVLRGSGTPPPSSIARELTVTKTGSGTGVVRSGGGSINCGEDCASTVDAEMSVTLTAIPEDGSEFIGWSGGVCSGASSTCTFNLNGSVTVTAKFDIISVPAPASTYDVTLRIAGLGKAIGTANGESVSCSDNEITCQGTFDGGAVFNLTAVPKAGYLFTGWSGVCTGVGACSFTLSGDTSVTANFTPASGAPTQPSINGFCGASVNTCSAGTLSDIADSGTEYLWQCLGTNGGATASCGAPISSVSTSPDKNRWGIFFVPPEWITPKPTVSQLAASMKQLGAAWTRVNFYSNAAKLTISGNTLTADFSAYKNYVGELHKQGISVLATIAQMPRQLSSDPNNIATNGDGGPRWATVKPADYNLWNQYIEQMARAFKDEIQVWEIWNEPGCCGANLYYWSGTEQEFAELVKSTSQAIKRGNPNARVAVSGFVHSYGYNFAEKLFSMGIGPYIDILTVHYTDSESSIITKWVALLKKYGLNIPIWNSEEKSDVPLENFASPIEKSFKFLHVRFTTAYDSYGPLVNPDLSWRDNAKFYSTGARIIGSANYRERYVASGVSVFIFENGNEKIGVFKASSPQTLTIDVSPLSGKTPTLTDKWGNSQALSISGGKAQVNVNDLLFINGISQFSVAGAP